LLFSLNSPYHHNDYNT